MCYDLRRGVISIGRVLIVHVVYTAIKILALFALLVSLGEENDDIIDSDTVYLLIRICVLLIPESLAAIYFARWLSRKEDQ